ncbi:hypothetical protein BDY19DRAFT_998402 [Irpex rosettiformis]|uniref:Uncharacterized protein n=1 Tax=Irpex rosettiformis TaxID=378272 RepID=A0ACB8TNX8_9APHY|nr:hypothetical protein BDY19DRAFT_998402 [Irpex rosettiformis]
MLRHARQFQWASTKSSQTSSQSELSSLSQPTSPSSLLRLPLATYASRPEMPSKSRPSCAEPTCLCTRIKRDCEHKCCKKHCLNAGGCSAYGHNDSGLPAAAITPPCPSAPITLQPEPLQSSVPVDTSLPPSPVTTLQLAALTRPDQSQNPNTSHCLSPIISNAPAAMPTPPTPSSTLPLAMTSSPSLPLPSATSHHPPPPPSMSNSIPSSSQHTRNTTPGPSRARHASHMKAVDVENYDRATTLAVKVTVWKLAECRPKTHIVQTGFMFPFFWCTREVLLQLGLLDEKASAEKPVYFQVYNCIYDEWEQAGLGHSIQLKKGDHPFLAAGHLNCDNLQDFDLNRSRYHTSTDIMHFRKNLAGERESVRSQRKEQLLQTAQALSSEPLKSSKLRPKPRPKHKSTTDTHSLPHSTHASETILSDSTNLSSDLPDLESFPFPWKRKQTTTQAKPGPSENIPASTIVSLNIISSPQYISSTSPEPRSQIPHRSRSACARRKASGDSDGGSDIDLDIVSIPSCSSVELSSSRRWPQDFFVCDIDACFAECRKRLESSIGDGSDSVKDDCNESDPHGKGKTSLVKEIFERFFGTETTYVKSTFYDVRKRYRTMTTNHRSQVRAALSAGHQKAGLWKNFVLTIPNHSKHRRVANAHRKVNKHVDDQA